MDRPPSLDDAAIFVAVARAGSFIGAARTLRTSKSSVSRAIANLEADLRVRLLQRTTRSLFLTPAGERYLAQVGDALAVAQEAGTLLREEDEGVRGLVRITAPPDVGGAILPPIVTAFAREHPGVSIEVTMQATPPLAGDGVFDLALWGGPLPDSSLVARKVQDTAFGLFASPDYLAKTGHPRSVDDLADHELIPFRAERGREVWQLSGSEVEHQIEATGRIGTNEMGFATRIAIDGAGIARLPVIMAAPQVEAGRLVRVLPDIGSRGLPLHLLLPDRRHVPRAVRLLHEAILARFVAMEP